MKIEKMLVMGVAIMMIFCGAASKKQADKLQEGSKDKLKSDTEMVAKTEKIDVDESTPGRSALEMEMDPNVRRHLQTVQETERANQAAKAYEAARIKQTQADNQLLGNTRKVKLKVKTD